MRLRPLRLAGLATVLALLGWCAWSRGPGGSGVLARLTLTDGSEFMLTQEWTGFGEPYQVDFWSRRPGQPWGWCYVDHEATRWFGVELVHDPAAGTIAVLRNGRLRASLSLASALFTLHVDDGKPYWSVPAPQEIRDPPLES